MAPFLGHPTPFHAISKRQLPHATFIGVAVAAGVCLVVLISMTLWCYVRGWRFQSSGRPKRYSEYQSATPRTGHSHRASRYWNADDIGVSGGVQTTEVTDAESRPASRVVVLPAPNLGACELKDRYSKIVKLPPPSLISWRSGAKEELLPQRASSIRVKVLTRHVSMQFKNISTASSTTLDRTPALDDLPKPGQQWSKVADLDWQVFRSEDSRNA